MIIIYIVLAISIGLNLLFIFYDILPYITPAVNRKIIESSNKKSDVNTLEISILAASMSLIRSKKSKMFWNTGGLYSKLGKVIRRQANESEFRNFNYPRGYLLFGLTEYLIKTDNKTELIELKAIFDKYYITNKGGFLFNFNKVDQAPFGLAALNLFRVFKEEKYKIFADNIYSFINHKYSRHKLVHYRENSKCELNDTIGMIVPFLVRYYQFSNISDALKIAENQINQFIKYGVDDKTFLPSHGFNLKTNVKTGSSNWGRGIGWYFFGLKELFELNGSFKYEYEGLCSTLKKLRNEEKLWGQFPGSNDNFDASTSTMFIYCLPHNEFTKENILIKLDKYISRNGYITQTSGDTEGLNFYSKFTSKSEFSQGILHLILSKYK